MTSGDIQALTVRQVFEDARYVVPVYQRAYAWGEREVLTLLQDVSDYNRRNAPNYYIGSLVTHRTGAVAGDADAYEVVDGQQRLTTLFVILATLADRHSARPDTGLLSFEGRPSSTRDLAILARRGANCAVGDLSVAGVRVAVETIRSAHRSGVFTDDDLAYLIDHVKVARTTLPVRTDLNHYFEVMNSRGEQLEKHEIVKAHLMSLLAQAHGPDDRSHVFATVWDACSDLTRHVQTRFPPRVRDALFSQDTWDDFRPKHFGDIADVLSTMTGDMPQSAPMSALLGAESAALLDGDTADQEAPDRYGAIIDFPNFLLHVLALSYPRRSPFRWRDSDADRTVSLDDKRLVEQFKALVTTPDHAEAFAYTLLRARYLFDKYVIRTDLTRAGEADSNWVLIRVRQPIEDKSTEDKKKRRLAPISTFARDDQDDDSVRTKSLHWRVVMLQSMFQVTDSRWAYKNFLYATLDYLYEQPTVTPEGLVGFLEGLARDRYASTVADDQLDTGTSVPHFALNYLDYLLWSDGIASSDPRPGVNFGGYRFKYRTSIEHFYPQNPSTDSQIEPLDEYVVNQFGNLCIMTRSENSQRSNLAPAAKVEQYPSDRQSLKFQIMAAITKGPAGWTPAQMESHGLDMRQVLARALTGDPEGLV